MLFNFLLDLLYLLQEFLKTLVWSITLAFLVFLMGAFAFYLVVSAFGLKESPAFQEYRDFVIEEIMKEHQEELEK